MRISASRPALLRSFAGGLFLGRRRSRSSACDALLPQTIRAQAPSALFVLGDSLSDVGNAAGAADYLLNLVIDPPTVGLCNAADVLVAPRRCDDLFYKQSRVSDGAVAVERLAAQLGLAELEPSLHVVPSRSRTATVYAVASAKARGPGEEDLGRQVDWLLLDHAPLPADAVYVIMIGGNDAIDAMQADVANAAAASAAERRDRNVRCRARSARTSSGCSTSARGGSSSRTCPISQRCRPSAPVAKSRGDERRDARGRERDLGSFDRQLDAALDRIEARGRWVAPTPPDIERFDLRAALAGVQLALAARGGNAVDACFDSEAYRDSAAAERIFHPACAPPTLGAAPRFGEFVFWDGIHPTGVAHAAIGDAMRALL